MFRRPPISKIVRTMFHVKHFVLSHMYLYLCMYSNAGGLQLLIRLSVGVPPYGLSGLRSGVNRVKGKKASPFSPACGSAGHFSKSARSGAPPAKFLLHCITKLIFFIGEQRFLLGLYWQRSLSVTVPDRGCRCDTSRCGLRCWLCSPLARQRTNFSPGIS